MVPGQVDMLMQKNEVGALPYTILTKNSKLIIDLNKKDKIIKI